MKNNNVNIKIQQDETQGLTKGSLSAKTNVTPRHMVNEISDADITPKIKALSDWLEKNIGKDAKDESKYCEKVERVLQILSMKISSFDKNMFIQILILANNYAHYLMVGCEFDKAEIVLIFWMEKSNCLEYYPWSMLLMSTYCNQLINIKDSTRVINLIDLRLKKFGQDLNSIIRKNDLDDTERLLSKSIISILICYKTASLNTSETTGLHKDLRRTAIDIVKKHLQNDSRLLKALKSYQSNKKNRNIDQYNNMPKEADHEYSIPRTQTYRHNSEQHEMNINADGASTYQNTHKNKRIRMKSRKNKDFTKNQSVDGKVQNKKSFLDEGSNKIKKNINWHLSEKALLKKGDLLFNSNSMPNSGIMPKSKEQQDINNMPFYMNQNFLRAQQQDNKYTKKNLSEYIKNNTDIKNNDSSQRNNHFMLKMKKSRSKHQNEPHREYPETNQNNSIHLLQDRILNNQNNSFNNLYEKKHRISRDKNINNYDFNNTTFNCQDLGYINTDTNFYNFQKPRHKKNIFYDSNFQNEVDYKKHHELQEIQHNIKDQKIMEHEIVENCKQLKNMQGLNETFNTYKNQIYTIRKCIKNCSKSPKANDESRHEIISKKNIKIRKSSMTRPESKPRDKSSPNVAVSTPVSITELKLMIQKNNAEKSEKKILVAKIESLQNRIRQARTNKSYVIDQEYIETPMQQSTKAPSPANLNIVQPFSNLYAEKIQSPKKTSLKDSQNKTASPKKKVTLENPRQAEKCESPKKPIIDYNSETEMKIKDDAQKLQLQENVVVRRKVNKFEEYYNDLCPIEERAYSESMNPTVKAGDTLSHTSKFIDEKKHLNLLNISDHLVAKMQLTDNIIVKSDYYIDIPLNKDEQKDSLTLAANFPKKYNTMITNMGKLNLEKNPSPKNNDLELDLDSDNCSANAAINDQIKQNESDVDINNDEINQKMTSPSIRETVFVPNKKDAGSKFDNSQMHIHYEEEEKNGNIAELNTLESETTIKKFEQNKNDVRINLIEEKESPLIPNIENEPNSFQQELRKHKKPTDGDAKINLVENKSDLKIDLSAIKKNELIKNKVEDTNDLKKSIQLSLEKSTHWIPKKITDIGSSIISNQNKNKPKYGGLSTPQHKTGKRALAQAFSGFANDAISKNGESMITGQKEQHFDKIFNKVKSEIESKNNKQENVLQNFSIFYKTMLVSMVQYKRYMRDNLFLTLEYKQRTGDDIFRIRFVTKPNIDSLIFTIIVQTDSSSTNTKKITEISDFLNESQFLKLFYVLPWMTVCPIGNPISCFVNFNRFLDKMFFPFVSIDNKGEIVLSRTPRSLLKDDLYTTFLGLNVNIKFIHLHDNISRVFLIYNEKIWFFDIIIEKILFWSYYHEQPKEKFDQPTFNILDRTKGAMNKQDVNIREPIQPKNSIIDLIKNCVEMLEQMLSKDDFLTEGKPTKWETLVKENNKVYYYFKIMNADKTDFYKIRRFKQGKFRPNSTATMNNVTANERLNSLKTLPNESINNNLKHLSKSSVYNEKRDPIDNIALISFICNCNKNKEPKMKRFLDRSYMTEEIGDWMWEDLPEEYKIFLLRRISMCTKVIEYHNTAVLQIKHLARANNKFIKRFHIKLQNYVCIATVRFVYVGYVLSGIQLEIYNPGIVKKKHILYQLDENSSRMNMEPVSKQLEDQIEMELKEHIEKLIKKKLKDNIENIFDEDTQFAIYPIESLLNQEQKIMISELFKKCM